MALELGVDGSKVFEILGDEECFDLLARKPIGRVAVSIGAIPAVFPVNYVFMNGAIYFYTGAGTKLAAAVREAVVAFEVDDYDITYEHGWSVLAVGVARIVDPDDVDADMPLRPWVPGARHALVRIWPDLVSGRRIGFPS